MTDTPTDQAAQTFIGVTQFYHDYRDPDVERLARAICAARGLDPDEWVRDNGYADTAIIPRWFREQQFAKDFISCWIAMRSPEASSATPNDKPQPDGLRDKIEEVNAACEDASLDPTAPIRFRVGGDEYFELHPDGSARIYVDEIYLPARPAGKLDAVKRSINELRTRLLRLIGLSG